MKCPYRKEKEITKNPNRNYVAIRENYMECYEDECAYYWDFGPIETCARVMRLIETDKRRRSIGEI